MQIIGTYGIIRQRRKDRKMVLQLPVLALGPNDPDDGEAGRQQRGMAIAAVARIIKTKAGYKVPAQSGRGYYHVLPVDNAPYCTCPDFEQRSKFCKHIFATQFFIRREEQSDVETPPVREVDIKPVPKPRHKRNESAFDKAQTNEKELFGKLLRGLCDTVPQPPQGMGRPRLPLSDMVYSAVFKVYSTLSTRRAITDIRNAEANGQLNVTPSYATIARYLRNPDLTPLLKDLIELSALPLSGVEEDFAVDSSGFSTSVYDRWFDHKWGREKKRVRWIKAHIMVGVQTGIITAAEISATHDSKLLAPLVKATARNFDMKEVSGDKAYLSKKNLHAIDDVGAAPYIQFKKNSMARPIRGQYDALWEKMFHLYAYNREEFLAHYHKRSNVETVFGVVKTKFGGAVRSKSAVAQENEVLCKFVAHNLCVLVHSMYDLGIAPIFMDDLELP